MLVHIKAALFLPRCSSLAFLDAVEWLCIKEASGSYARCDKSPKLQGQGNYFSDLSRQLEGALKKNDSNVQNCPLRFHGMFRPFQRCYTFLCRLGPSGPLQYWLFWGQGNCLPIGNDFWSLKIVTFISWAFETDSSYPIAFPAHFVYKSATVIS